MIALFPLRPPIASNSLSCIAAYTKSVHSTLHIWTSTIYGRLATQSTQHSSGREGCGSGHEVRLSVLLVIFVLMTLFFRHYLAQKTQTNLRFYIGDMGSFVISQFLETPPNLWVLDIGELVPQHLSRFVSSIQHTVLLELVLYTSCAPIKGPPTAGLAGLKKLFINWYAYDNLKEPESSLAHLYELIRPPLTTLVKLRIEPFDVFDCTHCQYFADVRIHSCSKCR